MAWTALPVFTAATLTVAQQNILRDNLMETSPAKATLPGQHFVATGVNTLAARRAEKQTTNVTGTTTSATYVYGLTTGSGSSPGPDFNVDTGQYAQVGLYCYLGATSTDFALMTFEVSGANDTPASDERASASVAYARLSTVHWLVAQTPGDHRYRAKYRVGSGTATFDYRTLWVLPF